MHADIHMMEDEPVTLEVMTPPADEDMDLDESEEAADGLDYEALSDVGQSYPDEPATLLRGPRAAAEEEADEDHQQVSIQNSGRNPHETQNEPLEYPADEQPFTLPVPLEVAEEEDRETDMEAFLLETSNPSISDEEQEQVPVEPMASKARGSASDAQGPRRILIPPLIFDIN
jgi:hypothetical protein